MSFLERIRVSCWQPLIDIVPFLLPAAAASVFSSLWGAWDPKLMPDRMSEYLPEKMSETVEIYNASQSVHIFTQQFSSFPDFISHMNFSTSE